MKNIPTPKCNDYGNSTARGTCLHCLELHKTRHQDQDHQKVLAQRHQWKAMVNLAVSVQAHRQKFRLQMAQQLAVGRLSLLHPDPGRVCLKEDCDASTVLLSYNMKSVVNGTKGTTAFIDRFQTAKKLGKTHLSSLPIRNSRMPDFFEIMQKVLPKSKSHVTTFAG